MKIWEAAGYARGLFYANMHHRFSGPRTVIGPRFCLYQTSPCEVNIGRDVRFMADCTVSVRGQLSIGEQTFFNRGLYISAAQSVQIGEQCLFGEYVSIHDENHVYRDPDEPIRRQGIRSRPVVVGDDVWIGAHSVILSGSNIGSHAIVGANSVVAREVEPYAIVVGSPAKKVGDRRDRSDVSTRERSVD